MNYCIGKKAAADWASLEPIGDVLLETVSCRDRRLGLSFLFSQIIYFRNERAIGKS